MVRRAQQRVAMRRHRGARLQRARRDNNNNRGEQCTRTLFNNKAPLVNLRCISTTHL